MECDVALFHFVPKEAYNSCIGLVFSLVTNHASSNIISEVWMNSILAIRVLGPMFVGSSELVTI